MQFIFAIVLILIAPAARAHGGGLNKEGCHNNRKTGDYHCHRGARSSPSPQTLTGIPRVTDGDTIRIGNTRIRLHGIDAPEKRQTCTADGKAWRCGDAATDAFRDAIGGLAVTCTKRDTDRYGRVVAVCWAGAVELGAWMVRQGWAVAYRRYSMDYVADENVARAGRRGLWRGEFVMPWVWRRR